MLLFRLYKNSVDIVFLESYVVVPPEHQPSTEEITAGFSISVWLQPSPGTNAFILAKSTPDFRVLYGVKTRTSRTLTAFEFVYMTATGRVGQGHNRGVCWFAKEEGLNYKRAPHITVKLKNVSFQRAPLNSE